MSVIFEFKGGFCMRKQNVYKIHVKIIWN